MGLVCVAACKDGLIAMADYKSDNSYKGKVGNIKEEEDKKRATEKLYVGKDFIVASYGSNIVKVREKDRFLENYIKFKKAKTIEKVLKKANKKVFYKEFYGFLVGYIDKNNKFQVVRYEFNLDTINPNKKPFIKTETDENGVWFGGNDQLPQLINNPFIYTKWETVDKISNELLTRYMNLINEKKESSVSLQGKDKLNVAYLKRDIDK